MGQWVKGQSGNPGGRPKLDPKVSELGDKESPEIFKKLIKLANGKPLTKGGDKPSITETLKAMNLVLDRTYGKPVAADGSGALAGVTFIVDTGIRRDRIEPPTIDVTPVNGEATDNPALSNDENSD